MSEIPSTFVCKNCTQSIGHYNFCPNCGAKKITKRITFKNLLAEFTNRFLNLDNSVFRTAFHLFSKPEEVIDGYIHGLRKRYIDAFGYFAISVTVTGIYWFLIKDRYKELLVATSLPEEQLKARQVGFDITSQYQTLISFLFIPLIAIISRIVFYNYKKYNLTEHFVIYLYAYSHIVVFTTLLTLPISFLIDDLWIVSFAPAIIYIIYNGYVLKRLYELTVLQLILKSLLFLTIGFVLFCVFSIITALVMILTNTIPTSP
ncbi:hypothetical protein GCM10022393_11270 [Aquimarina addita]|uniref:DUF3667 domain-containing protein n=1 Tax=Aquimarina addita TaxID=870485 RepID=A0ABP7XEA5_9FLAO